LDAWPRLVSRQVIWNDGTQVGNQALAPDDPAARRLDRLIASGGPMTEALRAAGVRFVVVDGAPLSAPDPRDARDTPAGLRLPGGLAALCQKAAGLPLPAAILVVDSASTDGTSDAVRGGPRQPVPVQLLRCERPGKGVAVRAGLLATQAPFVGFCDADMATDLDALDTAVGLLTAGHPVVIGSRALAGSVTEV